MDPEERARRLLAEIVRAAAEESRFPTRTELLKLVPNGAAPLAELVRRGLVAELAQQSSEMCYVPTLPGLRRADAAAVAGPLLSASERVLEWVRSRKQHRLAAHQLVAEFEVAENWAVILLHVLGATLGVSSYDFGSGPYARVITLASLPDPSPDSPTNGTAVMATDDSGVTLAIRNFRGIRAARWSPSGVCVVAGPNGAGKTTLLDALTFLRSVYMRGIGDAVSYLGGATGFHSVAAPPEEGVRFSLSLGAMTWEISPSFDGGAVSTFSEERLTSRGEILLERLPLSSEWFLGTDAQHVGNDPRCCLRQAVDARALPAAAPLVERLIGYRAYLEYDLAKIREPAKTDDDGYLHPSGRNLVAVLSNWHAAPGRFGNRFEWVIAKAREALPGTFHSLEFDRIGGAVAGRFYPTPSASPERSLPLHVAADGVLVTLLHLTAVAGAPDSGIVAIDEVENQLHPHAIRKLLASFEERADEHDLTILLTTHSPVVLNQFRDRPEKLFVARVGEPLVPLTELHEKDWLDHFSLGELYEREEFGAPPAAQSP